DHLRGVLGARGACFFRELAAPEVPDPETLEALWDLVWAGEVTNDAYAAVRATVGGGRASGRRSGAGTRPRPRPGRITTLGPPRGQGRWALVERELGPGGAVGSTAAGVAVAGLLLQRHGVLTREAVRAEGVPGGFAGIYPVLRSMEDAGRIRRGYFVTGLGAAQFAHPGAVDRLRAVRDRFATDAPTLHVLAATDPACAYGLAVPWPLKGPSRSAGAYVVLVDGAASLYLERGGRALLCLREADGSWEEAAVAALASLVVGGRMSRLALQRFPEELAGTLRGAGFTPTPKGLVRYA
ncbi:MAG: Lhr family helicase, partial [Acidimicrobiales bacterium]